MDNATRVFSVYGTHTYTPSLGRHDHRDDQSRKRPFGDVDELGHGLAGPLVDRGQFVDRFGGLRPGGDLHGHRNWIRHTDGHRDVLLGAVNATDQIGTGTLDAVNGADVATFSISTLTVSGSPYAITAVYGGDATHQGSTSNAASQTITPALLTITANNASKTYGQTATFAGTAFTETGLVRPTATRSAA